MLTRPPPFDDEPREYHRSDLNESPLVVHYELTAGVTLADWAAPENGDLTTEQTFLLLEQLGEFPKPPILVLTGGDPFCRLDIFTVAEYSTYCGLETAIHLRPSPWVSLWSLRRLRDAGMAQVIIDLDGPEDELHDDIRHDPGSFLASLETLVFAQETGFPVQVNTTITQKNYRMIDELAAMMEELEIDLWSVRFAVTGDTSADRVRIGPKEYEWVFERLWEHSHRRPYVIETVNAPQYRRYVYLQPRQHSRYAHRLTSPRISHRAFTTLGGNDGKGTLFIGHTGLIYPSESLTMLCGMFPQQSVVDVYQQSQLMQAFRDPTRLEGKCHRCEFRYVCGGCRARAYAVTGNPFAQEPDCLYQPIGLVGARD